MSKKRDSPESTDDTQTKEDSGSIFQQDDSAIRAKLTSLYDTTIEDLPTELIECILVKAITMEVVGLKLARNVWKEKADLVINRLSAVSPQWSNILTSNFFRNKLHRTLDQIAQKTIRLEILRQGHPMFRVSQVSALKDEIFLLCVYPDKVFAVHVHDWNNFAAEKHQFLLPKIRPECMTACRVSNCVYILYRKRCDYIDILRLTRDEEHTFNITPLITDVWMPNPKPTLSVAANGSLIFSRQQEGQLPVISIYNADGSVRHQIRVYSGIPKFTDIIPKSNGNLVLVSASDHYQTVLTEIDMDVTIIRQYQASDRGYGSLRPADNRADKFGRILLNNGLNRLELVDSEFNRLDFTGPQLDDEGLVYGEKLIYNSDMNEFATFVIVDIFNLLPTLTAFRFTET